MDEQEWLTCTAPQSLLQYLHDKISERKQRLLACACCRRIWRRLTDERSRNAVEVAERFVDKAATVEEFRAAFAEARSALLFANDNFVASSYAAKAAYHTVTADPWPSAAVAAARREVAEEAGNSAIHDAYAALAKANLPESDATFGHLPGEAVTAMRKSWDAADAAEKALQANLVREIFGNPFRPSLPVAPSVLRWNNGIVKRLAEDVYRECSLPDGTLDNARLAVLGDALLDAGCTDPELLAHLHDRGPHYRGCWAVDALLGKE